MKKVLIILTFLIASFILYIYYPLFTSPVVSAGDYVEPFKQDIFSNASILTWDNRFNLGAPLYTHSWVVTPDLLIAFGHIVFPFFSSSLLVKIFIFGLWFIFAICSMFFLYKYRQLNLFSLVFSFLIFTSNTYILMIMDGGQIAIALSYALFFVVLYFPIQLFIQKMPLSNKLVLGAVSGLLIATQMFFDLRIAYCTIFAVFTFWLVYTLYKSKNGKLHKRENILNIFLFFGSIFSSLLLHLFWILPTILSHQNPIAQLGSAYSSDAAVKFFSFAKFENTLGLVHPNWPENIFGKVSFMNPVFLILPLFAFGVLVLLKGKEKNEKEMMEKVFVLFFILLGLAGVFLAKGANDPLGIVYLWIFNHVPGFNMFRDPTKWYILIVASYAFLIPLFFQKLYFILQSKKLGKTILVVFITGFLLCLGFSISPALEHNLKGTFAKSYIPVEFLQFNKLVEEDNHFWRTLWVPKFQKYGYYSGTHPKIDAESLFNVTSSTNVLKILKEPMAEKLLEDASVRFVVVPYDNKGEIFLKDWKYNNNEYVSTIQAIKNLPWLVSIPTYGKLAVFEIANYKDHFWILSNNGTEKKVTYSTVSPTEYVISIKNVKKGDRLIFSENYDNNWIARMQNYTQGPTRYEGYFNSFILQKSGTYSLEVSYLPEKLVYLGMFLSAIYLFVLLGGGALIIINTVRSRRKLLL